MLGSSLPDKQVPQKVAALGSASVCPPALAGNTEESPSEQKGRSPSEPAGLAAEVGARHMTQGGPYDPRSHSCQFPVWHLGAAPVHVVGPEGMQFFLNLPLSFSCPGGSTVHPDAFPL